MQQQTSSDLVVLRSKYHGNSSAVAEHPQLTDVGSRSRSRGREPVVKNRPMDIVKKPNYKNRVIAMLCSLREEVKSENPARSWFVNDVISIVSRNLVNLSDVHEHQLEDAG